MDPLSHAIKRRLLVVDNDPDLADALCEWIALDGSWEAAAAYDSADALAQARTEPPDAILVDPEMPGADGFVTASRLRRSAAGSPPPLVALTGSPALQDAATTDTRFIASLLKPADLLAILDLLDRALLRH